MIFDIAENVYLNLEISQNVIKLRNIFIIKDLLTQRALVSK
jgi:hypothetical protein